MDVALLTSSVELPSNVVELPSDAMLTPEAGEGLNTASIDE